jgi:hypothetical protein
MFVTKKKKIKKYLEQKATDDKSAFDFLLSDYLDGTLKQKTAEIGISKIAIHIDWLDDIKCIGIQGRYNQYYLDLQIYQNEFTVSYDLDEADKDAEYPLESKEQFYSVLLDIIQKMK